MTHLEYEDDCSYPDAYERTRPISDARPARYTFARLSHTPWMQGWSDGFVGKLPQRGIGSYLRGFSAGCMERQFGRR
jgi:hypothetical protein